jgi:Spy/CpxP family protein refolding chaperone
MNRTFPALFAALLLLGASALQAQTPPADTGKGGGPRQGKYDCSQAKDPKLCEEQREKARARREEIRKAYEEARKACEGKQGPEHRECMTKSMCAKAPDPAKCETRAREYKGPRRAPAEAPKS